jgi:tRNA(Ile)-lysidine synthase
MHDIPPFSRADTQRLFSCLENSAGIVIAVSGGADSVALLALLAQWHADHSHIPVFCATVDHGLRAQSAQEAREVGALAARFNIPHKIVRWEGIKPQSGIEKAAREARYVLLYTHARNVGASHLLTAHTLDDQAETVLLRLAAGSGPAGLSAMRPETVRDGIVHARPLLGVSRQRLVATLQNHGINWCDDAMNADPRYARPRLRQARQVLEREGLSNERLGLFAHRMARMDDALDKVARELFEALFHPHGEALECDGRAFGALSEELALRVMQIALASLKSAFAYPRLEKLEHAVAILWAAAHVNQPAARTVMGMKCEIRLRKKGCVFIISRTPARRQA